MGMASSQCRFLALTSRKIDIGLDLIKLSGQKTSLTREMEKVSREYNDALNAKVLKWSNNQGVSYVDLSYNNLMKPSSLNNYNPYLLTEHNGKVIIDDDYKRYAELISPDGRAGADWISNRTAILSQITGMSTDDIDSYFDYKNNIAIKKENIEEIKRNEVPDPVGWTNIEGLLEEIDTKIGNNSDWKNMYLSNTSLGDDRTEINNKLNNLAQYIGLFFGSDDDSSISDAIESGVTDFMEAYDKMDSDTKEQQDWHKAIDWLFGNIIVRLYEDPTYTPENGTFPIQDLNDPQYSTKKALREAWENQYNSATEDYDSYIADFSSKYTAAVETDIKFYDSIFSSIADKGWSFNEKINDKEYLNQMLQNNIYTITSVKHNNETDKNEYQTNIASNVTNIFSVNDSDAKDKALTNYENKKAIIQSKETRIDTRMKNLETEQAAINQMIQGIKTVRDDNISTFMKVFTG